MAAVYSEYKNTEKNEGRLIKHINPTVLKARFLELYPHIGSIKKTTEMLGMAYRTFFHWRECDPEFAHNFEEAEEFALGVLEDEALRRAVYGTQKPVYQGGKLAGYTTEYSDTLLIVLLKARAPFKYQDRFAGQLTGANGQPLIPEQKVIHVHSNIPIAQYEEQIAKTSGVTTIPFEDVPNKIELTQEDLDLLA